jgi:hypothetical protein
VLNRYLADLRHDIEAQVLAAWANLRMTPEWEQQQRGALIGAQFLQALSLEQVRVFYGLEARG